MILLQKIDQLAGVSQILGEMSDDDRESENVWSGKSLELRTVSTALSAVLKAFTCQKAVNVVSSSDEEKQESYKEDVATYFADFCVENQNLGKQSNQAEDLKISLQPTLDALKSFHDYMKMTLTSYMRAVMIPLQNAVEEASTHSSLDLKPLTSGGINKDKLQEMLQSLLEINKTGLIDSLKNMSMYLKAFEKFQSSCPDIKHVDGQNFTALVTKATTVRQKGRMTMVLRSCANIILRHRPSEIEQVKAEAKRLKITIPKAVLAKLTSMERDEDQAEDAA